MTDLSFFEFGSLTFLCSNGQCSYTHCVPTDVVVIDLSLSQHKVNISLQILQRAHPSYLDAREVVVLKTTGGSELNVSVVQFDEETKGNKNCRLIVWRCKCTAKKGQ